MHQEKLIFEFVVRIFRPKQVLVLSFEFKPKNPHNKFFEHLVAISKRDFSRIVFGKASALTIPLPKSQKEFFEHFRAITSKNVCDNFLAEGANASIVSFCSGRGE